ncbi:uncharacterized protein TNCV_4959951 [Trichonephila clavipes]|uniref:Uncharacterized protein n=1 Tax=Trichonephila clavipes TaxID=2585209 RepID=A0A8X6VNR2_TRICX|nr:uncharacterized protein TNCV_4959951 [Trichonephila clavipes]
MVTLKPVKQKTRMKSGHRSFSSLTLLQHVEFDPAHAFFPTCSDFWLDFAPVVRMACERKFLESEATTGFFLLLGKQGNKAVLDWVMKEGLIPSRYECPKCKKDMRLVERKGTIDGFEWRCRVQSKENPHFVCRSVRKGTWFSDSRLSICVNLRLTRVYQLLVSFSLRSERAQDLEQLRAVLTRASTLDAICACVRFSTKRPRAFVPSFFRTQTSLVAHVSLREQMIELEK